MDYILPEKYRVSEDFLKIVEDKTKTGDIGVIVPGG